MNIDKTNMKKPQLKLFDFLEKLNLNIDLNCFLKFKNMTDFKKTFNRIYKDKDEFECDEYNLNLDQIKKIVDNFEEKPVKKTKKTKKSINIKKKTPLPSNLDTDVSGFEDMVPSKQKTQNNKISKKKSKKSNKSKNLTKEECDDINKQKKNNKNNKIKDPKTGREIKYKNKDGSITKKVKDLDEECKKYEKKSIKKIKTKNISLDIDEDECKVDNDCKSNCCINNKCVDGKICKKLKQDEQILFILKDLIVDLENFTIRIDESNVEFKKRKNDFINYVEKQLQLLKRDMYYDDEKDEEKIYNNLVKTFNNFKKDMKSPKKESSKKESPKKESPKKITPKKESPKKITPKEFEKIKIQVERNELTKDDYNTILKKLNLKTQKDYLKEILLIGLKNI